jgi:hypothetical protein
MLARAAKAEGRECPGDTRHDCTTAHCSATLSTDATSELHILGHDSDTLGMDSTEVRVLKETDEVSLRRFLQGQHSRSLKAKIRVQVLGNLTDQTTERSLLDQEIRRLLVPTDFTECHRARSPAALLWLHRICTGSTLAELLADTRRLLGAWESFLGNRLGSNHDVDRVNGTGREKRLERALKREKWGQRSTGVERAIHNAEGGRRKRSLSGFSQFEKASEHGILAPAQPDFEFQTHNQHNTKLA